jgi:hypothetical protein
MPAYKNQHYVPKAHLKPFSVGRAGKAINLYNITQDRLIPNAPTRGQCARDYLYGGKGDVLLEGFLQKLEGEYADLVRKAEADPASLTAADFARLRGFTFVQYQRTDMAFQRQQLMRDEVHAASIEGIDPKFAEEVTKLSDRDLIRISMAIALSEQKTIDDLVPFIALNKTSMEFVTSDDPAILTNRYSIQKMNDRNFGLVSVGVTFYLPLTPWLLFGCYDSGSYRLSGAKGHVVEVTSEGDVIAFNEAQLIKAGANLYFGSWSAGESIKESMPRAKDQRSERTGGIRIWVPTTSRRGAALVHGATRYREATPEERLSAKEKLIQMQPLFAKPRRWPSCLPIRNAVKKIETQTAIGAVRRSDWKQLVDRSKRKGTSNR